MGIVKAYIIGVPALKLSDLCKPFSASSLHSGLRVTFDCCMLEKHLVSWNLLTVSGRCLLHLLIEIWRFLQLLRTMYYILEDDSVRDSEAILPCDPAWCTNVKQCFSSYHLLTSVSAASEWFCMTSQERACTPSEVVGISYLCPVRHPSHLRSPAGLEQSSSTNWLPSPECVLHIQSAICAR